MRILGLAALLVVSAAPAFAQEASAAAPLPSDRICTVTTTVVRRGDVILSSRTNTECEAGPSQPRGSEKSGDVSQGGGGETRSGGGFHPNPGAILEGLHPSNAVKAIVTDRELKARELWGDWTVEKGSRQVCRVTLWAKGAGEVRPFQTTGCAGPITQATIWMMGDNGITLRDPKGAVIVELTGRADYLTGVTAAGDAIRLTR